MNFLLWLLMGSSLSLSTAKSTTSMHVASAGADPTSDATTFVGRYSPKQKEFTPTVNIGSTPGFSYTNGFSVIPSSTITALEGDPESDDATHKSTPTSRPQSPAVPADDTTLLNVGYLSGTVQQRDVSWKMHNMLHTPNFSTVPTERSPTITLTETNTDTRRFAEEVLETSVETDIGTHPNLKEVPAAVSTASYTNSPPAPEETPTVASIETYTTTGAVHRDTSYESVEVLKQSATEENVKETFDDMASHATEAETMASVLSTSGPLAYDNSSSSALQDFAPTTSFTEITTVSSSMLVTLATQEFAIVDRAPEETKAENVTTLVPSTKEMVHERVTTTVDSYERQSILPETAEKVEGDAILATVNAKQTNNTEEPVVLTMVPSVFEDTKDDTVPYLTTMLEVKSKDAYAMTAQLLSLHESMLQLPNKQKAKHGKKTSPASFSYSINDGNVRNGGKKSGGIKIIQNFDIFINPTANITKSTTFTKV